MGAWNIQPSEFWAMSPEEWWCLHEVKRKRDPATDYAGKLTETDVEELYGLLH